MPKFKRELVPGTYLTAADMMSLLSEQQFKAAAVCGRIIIAAQPPIAWLLDSCCVGRPAPQTAQATAAAEGGSSSSSWCTAELTSAVVRLAGVNTAAGELWQQYRQHQQQVLAHQQRKATKSARRAAQIAAAVAAAELTGDQATGDAGSVCLVCLSCQEAVFLSLVLGCCQVLSECNTSNNASCCWGPQQSGSKQQDTPHQRAGVPGLSQQVHHSSSSGSLAAPHLQGGAHQQDQHGPCAQLKDSQQQMLQQQQQHLAPQPSNCSSPAAVLSGDELWQWCCRHTPGGAGVFAPQYAAYHHLRCLGWLPLPGLAYGADYVLYELHPEFAHSDFVVTVMVQAGPREAGASIPQSAGEGSSSGPQPQQAAPAAPPQQAMTAPERQMAATTQPGSLQLSVQEPGVSGGLPAGDDAGQQQQAGSVCSSTQLAWLDACIMHRLARQVLKEMMLLYVVVPDGLSLLDIRCIDSMQVREVLVQRWVPSEHREGK